VLRLPEVDGRGEARLLATIMPLDKVAPVLATLLALGLLTAARHVPEPLALASIKGELADLVESYLGVMAGDVVMRVRQAGDAAQLMRVRGQWHMAMQASKHGKDAAAALL
jgi:hypothetical protein